MQPKHNDHRAGPVRVQTAQKRAARDLLRNVGYAGVCCLRCWRVIKRQRDPGDGLQQEDKQQAGTKDIGQPRASWNGLVEKFSGDSLHTGAFVQPMKHTNVQAPVGIGGTGFVVHVLTSIWLAHQLPVWHVAAEKLELHL
jgi:hypothetical protein